MVKSSAQRIAKYTAKVSGDVTKNRIDAQSSAMGTNYNASILDYAAIETSVGTYLDGLGITVALKPSYLSFARACLKKTKRHSGQTLHDELCMEVIKWSSTSRGLDLFYLATIIQTEFEIDVFDCTA